MMLFVLSWPATTLPSCALRCGIETQWLFGGGSPNPLRKAPARWPGKVLQGRKRLRCYAVTAACGGAKCVLTGSNSTNYPGVRGWPQWLNAISKRPRFAESSTGKGVSGGAEPHRFGGNSWRRNLAAMNASQTQSERRQSASGSCCEAGTRKEVPCVWSSAGAVAGDLRLERQLCYALPPVDRVRGTSLVR
jgi:hypothetical protein